MIKNFCVLIFLLICACSKPDNSRAEFVLGTICTITLFDDAEPEIFQDIFTRLKEIDNRMSVNKPDSDIARVNAAAGIEGIQVHDDTYAVLEKALYFAEISNGAFDPTIQPLTALWNISGEKPRLPDYAEIKAVLPLINWRDVELDPKTKTVFLKRPAMALDLGGIAKGYAADEAAVILAAKQVERAIIDLGGNILTYGSKPGNRLWKVGVQNPINGKRGVYTGIVSGYAQTVVTSGVYERFFESGGIRYHHIFNPVDGFPVRNGLLSVTIITGNSMDADGLSTTVFVLGYEKGKALIESIKGTEAIFIFEDRSVRITPGAQFSLTDTSFNLLND